MADWKQCTLGDLFTIKHGYAFKGEYFGTEGSHIVLTPGNFLEEGGFKEKGDKEKWYSGKIPEDYILSYGDLIVVMTEQAEGLLGSSAMIPLSNRYLHNQRLGLIQNFNGVDKIFVYYLFNSKSVRQQIRASCSGVKVRHTSPSRIYEVKVFLPPLPTQRKIAAILSAYDDLIENNTRRIKILEEIAQTIYNEWFVKFRFPGHENVKMVDSELGMIPEGWEVQKVKDILKRLKAGNVYTESMVQETGNIPVIDQSRSDYLGFHNNEADHKASPKSPIIIFGDHTCKMQLLVEPFSVGPNVVPFVSNDKEFSIYYLYYLVNNLVATKEYKRHWNDLTNKTIPLTDASISQHFGHLVEPMFQTIESLRIRNLNLSSTRDLLLPRLISGDIDVSELDINLEEITA